MFGLDSASLSKACLQMMFGDVVYLYEFNSEHKLLPEHSKCVNKIYLSLVYFAMMITTVLACYLQVSSTVKPPSRVTQ